VSGIFKILDALWAFKYDDVSDQVQTVLFERDLTSWGWLWLTVGIVLIAAGFAVVTGAEWARWVGIVAASIAAITFLPWIYYQPLWTILSVTLAVLVIYALAAHGGLAKLADLRDKGVISEEEFQQAKAKALA
jgi:hypothetical protein